MAATDMPAIFRLPEELLMLVASHLSDSGTPQHLKNFSLVSRKFRPAAQETLHTFANLSVSCGCHPKVNAALRLLRTLFNRPDLACKVRLLRFRTARKDISQLYKSQDFELASLRDRSLLRLQELGYGKSHPWWRSIENTIESAFGGLLLLQLPNLVRLDFCVKDHHRGPPSSECVTGLFGSTCPPASLAYGWRGIKHLTLGDTQMLKCGLELPSLTSLDLKTVSIGTVLRLNGPGCLQGTERLRKLAMTCSIQFADRPLKADIQLSNMFDALGCQQLTELTILLINDGYHLDDELGTQLETGYFMDQLCSVEQTLESLSITFEPWDDEGELEWVLEMCIEPKESLKHFTALKRLTIPQEFLFVSSSLHLGQLPAPPGKSCKPRGLPEKLEYLEITHPYEEVLEWATGFLDFSTNISRELPSFSKMVLSCRLDVGMSSDFFTTYVEKVWWRLWVECGIDTFVGEIGGISSSLAALYDGSISERYDTEGDIWTDENSDDEDEEDEEMPDLIDPMD
ncbi:hypothetical protein IAQ61_011841 [Plenodomus lingam]|uniref:uncharacterized protein n=1 Tax=Leptosphaeria maculans TaxID=5022 RepID=UPI003323DED7|nr:hypothetical protein IAQ61_011841 [Plenodomus lingam]